MGIWQHREFWAYFHRTCAETAIKELPVKNLTPPFVPATSISYKTDAFPLLSDVYWIHSMLLWYYDAWPCDLDLWPLKCFVFLLSYDYRLLSYDYWISDHISVIWNSHCACAVSRDLCIGGPSKPHVTIFWPRIAHSLYNFYAATMTIKGSLY